MTSTSEIIKELLPDPTKRIALDDYITLRVRHFLNETDSSHFPVQTQMGTKEEFIERIKKYEELSGDLQQVVILLAKWSDKNQLNILENIFKRIAEAERDSAGLVWWIHLSWYPLIYLMYSAGISALAAKNYAAIRVILQTSVNALARHSEEKSPAVSVVAMGHVNSIYDQFKLLPGCENRYTPMGDHLFDALQPKLEDLLFLGKSYYEETFDNFEIILALVYAVETGLGWGPPGRFAWKHSRLHGYSPFDLLVKEAEKEGPKWGLVEAGVFRGSIERFLDQANKYRKTLDEIGWW